jgi:hypothetical protein
MRAVDPILITDQVARGLSPSECLCNLACDPFRRRSSVMSAAIFETDSKGDDHPCCAGRPEGVCFFHADGAVNRR